MSERPNVALVHGAWAHGFCWSGVIERLQHDGYTVSATPFPAPRRLIVLGGGSAGVEIAQVVWRLGGQAVLVEGADRLIPREPAPSAWL